MRAFRIEALPILIGMEPVNSLLAVSRCVNPELMLILSKVKVNLIVLSITTPMYKNKSTRSFP